MPNLEIWTDDPDFLRDLKEANIPGLEVEQRGNVGRMLASAEVPPMMELLRHTTETAIVIFVLSFSATAGRAAVNLLRDFVYDRMRTGNPHEHATTVVEGKIVTYDPEQARTVINNFAQQIQINIDNKPNDEKQP